MRTLFFLFLLFLTILPQNALAAYGCPKFQTPKITIKTIMAKPSINHTNNLDYIRHLGDRKQRTGDAHKERTPVGLNAATMSIQTNYRITTAKKPSDKLYCGQVTKMTITFGISESIIYIPTELKKHSCEYRSVLEHERKHVAMDRAFVKYAAPRIKRELGNIIKRVGFKRGRTPDIIKKKIEKFFAPKSDKATEKYKKIRVAWQAKVDTEKEYARISKSCNGKISEIVGKAQSLWNW